MNPQNFDDKPVITKSKRGRKALSVSEGHIDTTGRTHIMTVRRSNHPTPKKKAPKAPKSINQNNNYCRRCEQNDEYIDALNDRIGKLETLVNKSQKIDKPLSNIGAENLDNSFNPINNELFERLQTQLETTLTPNIDNFNDRIGKLESFRNTTIPYIGTEDPFKMQSQIQQTIFVPVFETPRSLFYTGTEDRFKLQSPIQLQNILSPPIGVINDQIGNLENSLNYIRTENPFEMQSQIQNLMEPPATISTPYFGITNEPIGHLESLLNKPKLPQPHIGTEKPFEMQNQLHSQMASPSTTLTPSYEPVDFANWNPFYQ
ncbi:10272_t:CDS:1 [Funneliformis mosseae]|uniref:10272_t:CDS:1 n=1 Tax=Funneliformis mosseae TaxID=27381 RepID=A0A9N9ACK6_FUNMO|nr:10272_t:CDS:1 [Funneliformis mosseae]